MKKLLFILFLTLFSFNAIGQVWIDSGAVWHYDFWTVGAFGFDRYEYSKDTIIENKNCQQITGMSYGFTYDMNHNIVLLGHQDLGMQITYVSGDTVFYRNNDAFFILYNFGAAIGDQWVISTTNPFGECDDTSRIEVVDTGTITLNTVNYRFIKVQPTSNSPLGFKGTYVERFGNIDGTSAPFQYLFPGGYQCDSLTPLVEWNFYRFKCFEDSSFTLYNPSTEDCEYYLTYLGIHESDPHDFICYPNPTSGLLYIDSPLTGDKFMEIYNYQGSLVRTIKMPENSKSIDISALKSGIYFLKIKSQSGDNFVYKIIKE